MTPQHGGEVIAVVQLRVVLLRRYTVHGQQTFGETCQGKEWNCALQAAHQLQVIKEVPLWELNTPMGNPGQLKRNSSKNRRCPSHV